MEMNKSSELVQNPTFESTIETLSILGVVKGKL